MTRRIVVTAALPYANGPIHLGHLVEYLQADIWARYHRLVGHDVLYLCADDAHGTPIMLRARKEGIEPAELVAAMQESHQADFDAFHVQFDQYHSTHSDENRQCAERIYTRLKEGGHIVRKTIEQAYDPEAGMFLPDRFIKGTCPSCGAEDQYGDACENCGANYSPTDLVDPVSVVSGATPTRRESEHLFFRLADFEDMLKEWTGDRLQDAVRNKLQEWFDAGLADWDISRDAPYWGFAIPGETDKYFYVWLDAPIGYQASHLKWCAEQGRPEDFEAVWGPDSDVELYHFIGKDISYFHNLFWPAMLHGAGFRKPTAVFVHGFLKVNGRKMSKSRGTFINAADYLAKHEPEALRFYFASKLNDRVEDIDLALEDFVFRVNSNLIGKIVNIASRCGSILHKTYDGQLATTLEDPALYTDVTDARARIAALYEERAFGAVVRDVVELADRTNKYIDTRAPWSLKNDPATFEEGRAVCTQALNQFRALITLLAPIVPRIAADGLGWLGTELSWDGLDTPLLGTTIGKYQALIQRLDQKKVATLVDETSPAEPRKKKKKPKKKAVKEPAAEIGIDQFLDIDLRVGRVEAASLVEGADALLQLTVDIGRDAPRNIFAGIRAAYAPEDLVGRLVVVVANLAPRKMRFGVSEGMVLAAGDGPQLVAPDEGAVPGMRVR
jgi:methionyl-tRNA synthetase